MARNINTGTLTKNYVLSKVSQVTIFSAYLNLSNVIIEHCIQTGELILSPIRYDEHPTCGFRYDARGKLKFKDFNGYFWGDCFDLVAFVISNMYNKRINISNKQDFIQVLRHITLVFKDIFYGQDKDISLITEINTAIVNIRNAKPVIELVVRNWNESDKSDWEKIGVPIRDLNINFIHPVEQYYINRNVNPEPKYYYNPLDPCYAYMQGKDRNGIHSIGLYFPKRQKGLTRFIKNYNHLEGIHNLDDTNYDVILVTKSTKDRVSIGSVMKRIHLLYGQDIKIKLGIINIPHETYRLRQNEYDWLRSKLKPNGYIFSLMDNDRVGKAQAIWLRTNFMIIPLLIPKNTYCKDFAELRERTGEKHTINLFINTINNIKHYAKLNEIRANKLIGNIDNGDDMPF